MNIDSEFAFNSCFISICILVKFAIKLIKISNHGLALIRKINLSQCMYQHSHQFQRQLCGNLF